MTPSDYAPAESRQSLNIDLGDLVLAMEMGDSDDHTAWLDRHTGKIIVVPHEFMSWGGAGCDDFDDDVDAADELAGAAPPRVPAKWEQEMVAQARIIEDDESGRYEDVPSIEGRDGFRIMQNFAQSIKSGRVRHRLLDALSRPKPFGRFKDALADWPEVRDKFYAYDAQHKRQLARDWLEAIGIQPIDTPSTPPPPSKSAQG